MASPSESEFGESVSGSVDLAKTERIWNALLSDIKPRHSYAAGYQNELGEACFVELMPGKRYSYSVWVKQSIGDESSLTIYAIKYFGRELEEVACRLLGGQADQHEPDPIELGTLNSALQALYQSQQLYSAIYENS